MQQDVDAKQGAPQPHALPTPARTYVQLPVNYTMALSWLGTMSYGALCYVVHKQLGQSQQFITDQYYAEAPRAAFEWPMVAFGGALLMNLLTVLFERDGYKMKLALVSCYINFLACSCHALHLFRYAPIIVDPWGVPVETIRVLMWLHATPAMVYLLSIISDFTPDQVAWAVTADFLMLISATLYYTTTSKALAVIYMTACFVFFIYLLKCLFQMFSAPIRETPSPTARLTLMALRAYTMVFWTAFPVLWVVSFYLPCGTMACLWAAADVMGKIIFSTSLLQGNLMSLNQRRISAMRAVEEASRMQAVDELEKAVQQKEMFLSSVSHELRTPLNGIIGLSEAMLVGGCGDLNEGARKMLGNIRASGARLLNLINDILDIASIKQGRLTVRYERVNLQHLVSDVMDLCQPLVKPGVKLQNNIASNTPAVLGDSGRIVQILYNLVGNSCKFTHAGMIAVDAMAKGEAIEVFVRDTGIGIPKDKFDAIFNQFEQVDMSTTRKYGGTGLGLALVRSLVEAHEGNIHVASELGKGTTFSITFKKWNRSPKSSLDSQNSTPKSSTLVSPALPAAASPVGSLLGNSSSSFFSSAAEMSNTPRSVGIGITAREAGAAGSNCSCGTCGAPSNRNSNDSTSSLETGSRDGSERSAGRGRWAVGAGQGAPVPNGVGVSIGGTAKELISPGLVVTTKACGQQRDATGTGPESSTDGRAGATPKVGGGEQGLWKGVNGASRGVPNGEGAVESAAREAGGGKDGSSTATASPSWESRTRSQSSSQKQAVFGSKKERNSQLQVLSVDDDPINQMVVSRLLNAAGFTNVAQAMNGEEALTYLKSAPRLPDIILMDVMMPGMSGYELCRKVREQYSTSCIPIIMVSAKSAEDNVVEGLMSGSNDYVTKPFRRKELLARISAHVEFRDRVKQSVYEEGALEFPPTADQPAPTPNTTPRPTSPTTVQPLPSTLVSSTIPASDTQPSNPTNTATHTPAPSSSTPVMSPTSPTQRPTSALPTHLPPVSNPSAPSPAPQAELAGINDSDSPGCGPNPLDNQPTYFSSALYQKQNGSGTRESPGIVIEGREAPVTMHVNGHGSPEKGCLQNGETENGGLEPDAQCTASPQPTVVEKVECNGAGHDRSDGREKLCFSSQGLSLSTTKGSSCLAPLPHLDGGPGTSPSN